MASARASMDINSPSERWADLVGAPMAQGLGKGFTEQMREVTRQINDSIPTITMTGQYQVAKMGEGIVKRSSRNYSTTEQPAYNYPANSRRQDFSTNRIRPIKQHRTSERGTGLWIRLRYQKTA